MSQVVSTCHEKSNLTVNLKWIWAQNAYTLWMNTYNSWQNKGIMFRNDTAKLQPFIDTVELLLCNGVEVNGYIIVVNVLVEIWAR